MNKWQAIGYLHTCFPNPSYFLPSPTPSENYEAVKFDNSLGYTWSLHQFRQAYVAHCNFVGLEVAYATWLSGVVDAFLVRDRKSVV